MKTVYLNTCIGLIHAILTNNFSLFAVTDYSFGFALADEELLPPDQAFKISAKAITSDQLEISWEIAEGYYLYRNKMQFKSKTEQIHTVTPVFPAGETKHDENFGDVVIYRNNLRIPVSLAAANEASSIQLLVQYQGCADRGICYPPQKKTLISLCQWPHLLPMPIRLSNW